MPWNRANVENVRLFQISIRGLDRIPQVAGQ